MKKSQLRNIIRESIKELMVEQASPGCSTFVVSERCDDGVLPPNAPSGQTQGAPTLSGCITYGGQPLAVGDIFYSGPNVTITNCNSGNVTNATNVLPYNQGWFKVTSTTPASTSGGPNQCNQHNDIPTTTNRPPRTCFDDQPPVGTSWNCEQTGDHPKFGSKCVEVQGTGGQFQTQQDCMESGCEGMRDRGQGPYEPMTMGI